MSVHGGHCAPSTIMTRFGLERGGGWPAAKWSLLEERGAQSPSSPRGHFQLLRTHHKEQNGEAFPDRRLCLASLISGRGAALLLPIYFQGEIRFPSPLSFSLSLFASWPSLQHLRSSSFVFGQLPLPSLFHGESN